MPGKDYLAIIRPEAGDRVDHGVKGMKWGVRRSAIELKAATAYKKGHAEATAKREAAKKATGEATPTKKPAGEESSAERYSRLMTQAKGGGARSMSDDDLKFFNARTEALAKVNKMVVTQDSWLKKTTTNVLQNAAQKQMQAVTDGVATKYIAKPILKAINDNSAAVKAESKTPIDYVGKHRAKK